MSEGEVDIDSSRASNRRLGFGFWDLGFGIYLGSRLMNQFAVSSTGADEIVSNPNRS
jgi:hypothetical protein